MIRVRLKEQMEAYRRRTGETLTYADLAARTGLSRPTLESMATRSSYNTTLTAIDRICAALDCLPGDLLEREADIVAMAGQG
ncbi:helix-turn-helix transcriptional regulator [Sphingomonas sp. C8-2]|nr:helix-turn-helix transcriptional regulator [Sphingomonas sp. C8-2]